jgi:hypothetical protein
LENWVFLVGFPQPLAASAYEHFGTLNLNLEGRAYDFLAANVAIQARSPFMVLVGWKLKFVS